MRFAKFPLMMSFLLGASVAAHCQSATAADFESNLHWADMGQVQAQLMAGKDYLRGVYTKRDYAAGKMWLEKAQAQGSVEASAWIGSLYLFGHGVPEDTVRAVAIETKGAEVCDPTSLMFLGIAHQTGKGTDKSLIKARDLFEMAAHGKNARAMDLLAMFYLAGTAVPKSSERELELLTASAALGDEWGELHLGDAYRTGRTGKRDYALAIKWYQASASQNNPMAKFWLGAMHESGQGVQKDYNFAAKSYKDSAWMGFAPAQAALSALYESGNGVPQDTIEAYAWLKLSADRKEQGAVEKLPVLRTGMSESQVTEGENRAAAYSVKIKAAKS